MTNPFESPTTPLGVSCCQGRMWVFIGAQLAGLAVILGAFGAHGIEDWLQSTFDDSAKRLANWETATRYMMYHSIGVIVTGLLWNPKFQKRSLATVISFLTGIVLFSGCLLGWVVLDSKPLVMIVPVGGLAFIIGWLLLGMLALAPAAVMTEKSEREPA